MYKGHPIIALCMVRADDERNFTMIEALSKKVQSVGARLIIYQSSINMHWTYKPEGGERVIYNLVDFDYVDLVIVFSEIINDNTLIEEIVNNAKAHNKPIFTIGKPWPGCTNFGFLYVDGIEKAIRHVKEVHGCTDFCFVAGPKDEPTSEARIKKYKEIMTEYGLTECLDRVFYGGYWRVPAIDAANQILAMDHLPKAVICANDLMAIAIIDVFKEHGIRVPEDVIITGLDATIESQANLPSITTSGCDMNELANMLVTAGMKAMNNEPIEEEYWCPFALIEGQSCGCKVVLDSAPLSEYLKYNITKQNEKLYLEWSFHTVYEKILRSPDIRKLPEVLDSTGFVDSLEIMVNEDTLRNNINPLSEGFRAGFDKRLRVLFQTNTDLTKLPFTIDLKQLTPRFDELIEKGRPIILSPLCFFTRAIGYLVYSPEVDNQNYYMLMTYTNSLSEILGCYSMVRHLQFNADQMDRMARHDYLTDLYNRTGFYSRLPQLSENDDAAYLAVTSVDMDGLKRINDKYGHETGDLAIRYISRAVVAAVDEHSICGRFGGDEFVICSIVNNEDEVDLLHERIHDYLREHMINTSLPCEVTASIGTCVMKKDEFDFDAALKISDERMYKEKSGKKNRRTE